MSFICHVWFLTGRDVSTDHVGDLGLNHGALVHNAGLEPARLGRVGEVSAAGRL